MSKKVSDEVMAAASAQTADGTLSKASETLKPGEADKPIVDGSKFDHDGDGRVGGSKPKDATPSDDGSPKSEPQPPTDNDHVAPGATPFPSSDSGPSGTGTDRLDSAVPKSVEDEARDYRIGALEKRVMDLETLVMSWQKIYQWPVPWRDAIQLAPQQSAEPEPELG